MINFFLIVTLYKFLEKPYTDTIQIGYYMKRKVLRNLHVFP